VNSVRLRPDAEQEFYRLSRVQQKAIAIKLKSLEKTPCPDDSKELDGYPPLRRIKAGDVRAIYDPEPDSKGRIFVWRIGTDHSIYELEELFKEYQAEAGGD
jgi:mRNA-degrading endonuclease RelE of RelBE toxin-antitoxin system